MPAWLDTARAYMVGAGEMSGFADHGGELYPPAFSWYVFATTQPGPHSGGREAVPTTTDVLATHCPLDGNFIAECAAVGIKCLCYVTYAAGPPSVSVPSQVVGLAGLQSDTYMGVNFAPVWWEKTSDGSVRTDDRFTGDGVGVQYGTLEWLGTPLPCPNTRSYLDAMLAWIDVIMSRGAHGIYVDGVALRQACYGDIENQNNTSPHTHLYTPTSNLPDLNPSDPSNPFEAWVAAVSQADSGLSGPALTAAQEDAARQGAQNYAYAQLLQAVRRRVRDYNPDAVVLGSVGWPTFPALWMKWFQQHLDGAFMEGFVTQAGTGARTAHFGPLTTGFFNTTSWQPPGSPTAPQAIPWPGMVSRGLPAWTGSGRRLFTLSTLNRYGHGGNTPPNTPPPPPTPLDIPVREDAFFTYCASQIAGGSWAGSPVWLASPFNQNTDFADLHQVTLGAPVAKSVEIQADGQVGQDLQTQPVTTLSVWEQAVLAINWTNQPTPLSLADLTGSIAGALPPGSRFQVPTALFDLFNRQLIDLTDPAQANAPIVPGANPGNPVLPGQARIYLFHQQPAYRPPSSGSRGLAPTPGPILTNADMFGPPADSQPVLPGGPFLYNFTSTDVFGIQTTTGAGGKDPFPQVVA